MSKGKDSGYEEKGYVPISIPIIKPKPGSGYVPPKPPPEPNQSPPSDQGDSDSGDSSGTDE